MAGKQKKIKKGEKLIKFQCRRLHSHEIYF